MPRAKRSDGPKRSRDHGGGLTTQIRSRLIWAENVRQGRRVPKEPELGPSICEMVGPLAGEDVPLGCRWIDGKMGEGGRYCGHGDAKWCQEHKARVYVAGGAPAFD